MSTPLSTIPLRVGDEEFAVLPTMAAMKMAELMDVEVAATNRETLQHYISAISEQIPEKKDRERFVALWSQPGYTQGMLLDLYEQMIEHYARRPTAGPSPYSGGFGIPASGETSTPVSSSEEAPASTRSPMTLAG